MQSARESGPPRLLTTLTPHIPSAPDPIGLTPDEESTSRAAGFRSRIRIDITGRRERQRNVVRVDGIDVFLTEAAFKAFLLLVVAAIVCTDGWVDTKLLRTGVGLGLEGQFFPSGVHGGLSPGRGYRRLLDR